MKLLKTLFLSGFLVTSAYAESFVVEDVQVDGLQRITAGSFFNYLPVRRGERVDSDDFPSIIRELYQTGFFDNIDLQRSGGVLKVSVKERPIIGEINIEGNQEIKKDQLIKGLVSLGLGTGDAYDVAKLNDVEKELLEVYHSRSKFDVMIDVSTRQMSRNRVALDVNVKEGISARIKQINIVGNKAFSEKELLEVMKLTPTKWHSLLSKGDRYSGQKLKGDIETLESYYFDRGFLDFRVNSTQVSLTEDKRDVYITINISEGLPYRVYENQFATTDVMPQAELENLVTYGIGDYYSRQAVRETQREMKNALGDKGYAFASVQVLPNADRNRHDVSVRYLIEPGKKVYVRRVEFEGNYKTNDEVLRREMRQMESALYNYSKLERSTQRLQRLGYINSVKRKEVTVPGRADQVDVVYTVSESASRSITAGVGYGSSSGLTLNAGYTTSNFFGTGNHFSFDFDTSETTRSYAVAFTDPYFTVDGISRTFSLYYTREDDEDIGDWTSDTWGAFVRFGFPVNEYESFKVGGGYRGAKIKTGDDVTPEIPEWLDEHGEKFNEFVVDFNWTHDTRDKTIFSNTGSITRFSAEVVTPGSTETYYKTGLRNRSYFKLNDKLIASVRGDISYGDGYGDTEGLPFFRNYYAGGLTTVRGYEANTLGPRWSNDDVKGGNLRVTGGAELILPWHLGQDAETVRLGTFVDFGNVYDGIDDFDASDFRYSAGLYLLWRSPIGPLNLSYGVPLNEKKGDELERFQFTIGVPL